MQGERNLESWRTLIVDEGFCGDIFATQRKLRAELIDSGAIRFRPARDLAAHMLLHLDDLSACWNLATKWLRLETGCQRVDAGFGTPQARKYYPSFAEATDENYDVPTLGGSAVNNDDPVMQAMWLTPRPVVFADMKQDSRLQMRLRQRLSRARTKTKIGGALRFNGVSYGLICADWTEHFAPNDADIYERFEQTVVDVLSPIIAVARVIDRCREDGIDAAAPGIKVAALTKVEAEIAKLVAMGLSYKQIALIRKRSFSTIDHQLRSIRQKTGVTSTSALISLLAKIDTQTR